MESSQDAKEHGQGHPPQHAHANASNSRTKWIFWGFVAVAAFFLLTEHRAHLFGILPFLLLLLCPLMHLFHSHGGGHAGHGGDGGSGRDRSEGERK